MKNPTKRPGKRYQRYSELDAAGRAAVDEYCHTAHPTNVPADKNAAWWDIDKRGKAGLFAGRLL